MRSLEDWDERMHLKHPGTWETIEVVVFALVGVVIGIGLALWWGWLHIG